MFSLTREFYRIHKAWKDAFAFPMVTGGTHGIVSVYPHGGHTSR